MIRAQLPEIKEKVKIMDVTPDNYGLAEYAQLFLGIKLDKSLQKALWRVRPLPTMMLDYAVADSVILIGISFSVM